MIGGHLKTRMNYNIMIAKHQKNMGEKYKKVKVKCTLVQALRLCTGCTVHRGE
jgi:hypothetical protein